MSTTSIPRRSGTTRGPSALADRRRRIAFAITFALALITIALQIRIGLFGDVSWLITADDKWLDGQIPYVDFIEINPPASLLLYLPAVELAHELGLRPELTVSAFGFGCIAASLGLSAAVLSRAGLAARVGPVGYACTLIALALLPGGQFCERDHLAAVFALPFIALCVARAERAPISLPYAALAGVGVGLMASIKPPYALVAIALAPYLAHRIGLRVLIGAMEYYAAGGVGLIYIFVVAHFFPGYINDVMDIGVHLYVPVRESLRGLMSEAGTLLFFAIGLLGFWVARQETDRPFVVVLALAAIGAFAAFLVQGKGWLYQALPALMFLTMAAGFALDPLVRSPRELLFGALAMIMAALGIMGFNQLGLPILAATIAAAWLCRAAALGNLPSEMSWVTMLPRFGLVASIGAVCGLGLRFGPSADGLAAALGQLGPHPTVVGVTEELGFFHPMVRRVGAIWVARVPSQWMTSAARRLEDNNPGDAALAALAKTYVERDRKMFVDDMRRLRPDAILVGPTNTRFHDAIWSDPEIVAARAPYRLFATNSPPERPAELWVRKDLIGLPTMLPEQPADDAEAPAER